MEKTFHLFQEHQKARFPDATKGKRIYGIDLVTLDADTNGCIDNYFDESGKSTLLDPKKFKVLSRCRAELFLVLKELEGDGREYFQRLLQIASGILEEQEK